MFLIKKELTHLFQDSHVTNQSLTLIIYYKLEAIDLSANEITIVFII